MIVDRDYQIAAVLSVPEYFKTKSGNPVIAMPTGTGKSVVIARLCQYIHQYPNQKVLIVTHVKELIEQNLAKLLAVWPQAPAGVYSAGLKRKDTFHRIIFAGIASIAKRAIDFGKVDIMMIDEAHLVSPKEETLYRRLINDLLQINPFMKVVGLTATPWRIGHGKITEEGGIFTDICFDMTSMNAFNWLISEGYLLPLIPKPTRTQYDIEGVHTKLGEFNLKELQAAVDKDEITRAALQEACEYGVDRHSWIIFAAGVHHAVSCSAILNSLGVSCTYVHSDMPDKERDDNIADWKAGKYRCIANNGILTTGVDHPALDFIIMLRHTMSTVLWVQMLGRGTRPFWCPHGDYDLTTRDGRLASIAASQKQNTLVLDFANNVKRLGPINDPVVPHKKGKGGGEAPVKLCGHCNTYNHSSARHCFYCGAEFQFLVKLKTTASTDELIKSDSPIVETFNVAQVEYAEHVKAGGQRSIRVTYHTGLTRFKEWVPITSNYGLAKRWWKERVAAAGMNYDSFPLPETIEDALMQITRLPVPTHIRVWVNQQYPSVLAHCFDGSKFGELPPSPVKVPAQVTNEVPAPWKKKDPADIAREQAQQTQLEARLRNTQLREKYGDMDDDIPF